MATATRAAQGEAHITQSLAIAWSGPADKGDYITVVQPDADDGAYRNYAYVPENGDTVALHTPDEAGDWDVVFHMGDQVLARERVRISAAE